jgi:hypothetical protein
MTEADTIDIDISDYEKKNGSFYFATPDISAISSIMYGMMDIVKQMRIHVGKEGISISERVACDNIFIFAKFEADQFEKFKCKEESVICFEPQTIYNCMNGFGAQDVMYWKFDKEKPTRLLLGIMRKGGEGTVTEYTIPLLRCETNVYTSPTQEMDYMLAFDTTVITNIISGFNNISKDFHDDFITISCDKEKIVFEKKDGCTFRRARFVLRTSAGPGAEEDSSTAKKKRRMRQSSEKNKIQTEWQRKVEQSKVVNKYSLQHLHQLQKCFSINRGFILMYIKNDYPIVFEIDVGTLGKLRAVLMFQDSNDSDNDSD